MYSTDKKQIKKVVKPNKNCHDNCKQNNNKPKSAKNTL